MRLLVCAGAVFAVLSACTVYAADSSDVLVAADSTDLGPATGLWLKKKPVSCRPSLSNPQTCRMNGRTYRYRNRAAVYRGGKWYKNSRSSEVWKRGRFVRGRVMLHPTDPRYKMIGGRWVPRFSKARLAAKKFVKSGHFWWRSARKRLFWNHGRWNRPYWQLPQNNPRFMKVRGRFVRRRRGLLSVSLWNGLWRRNGGSKGPVAYWNGKWRPLGKVLGRDPNLRKIKGRWSNIAVARPTPYVLRFGRWFKKKSDWTFRARKWVRYSTLRANDPRFVKTRRGRWRFVKGAGKAYTRRGNVWYRPNGDVYRNGRWISGSAYRRRAAGAVARRAMRQGSLPSGMREAVKEQVQVNFSKFIKWFVSNYLRGGNNLDGSFRAKESSIGRDGTAEDGQEGVSVGNDQYNPQPYSKSAEPEARGVSSHGPPPVQTWLVDGRVQKTGDGRPRTKGTGGDRMEKSTIDYAERNSVGKGVFGVKSDDAVSNGRGIQAASFIASSSSSSSKDGESRSDEDVGDNDTVFTTEQAPGAHDPTLPAQLNGGEMGVEASSDPSIAH